MLEELSQCSKDWRIGLVVLVEAITEVVRDLLD